MENDMQTMAMPTHKKVVQNLKELLDTHPEMKADLETSLKGACDSASAKLNSDLYNAINNVFDGDGWPQTVDKYYDYLDIYVRIIPNEENDPEYPTAWTSDGTKNGYNQKVYDLLCQFYWLVNTDLGDGQTMQTKYEAFAAWLVEFAVAWGSYLNTPESLTDETLASFIKDPMYNMELYIKNKGDWKSFNTFFYREFNDSNKETGITPLRPIAEPNNNQTIVAPADCTFKDNYHIDQNGNVVDDNGVLAKVTLKNTHTIGTVDELLTDSDGTVSPYAKDFYNGTFVHYFLSPFDYHRFHTSVSGKVLEIKDIRGKVYLNVVIDGDQWDAPDGAEDGYEFSQSRGLIIVDAGETVGKVAIVPIGMAQVSGVDMYNGKYEGQPNLNGKEVVKGQEFGKFMFGGSDIILLFEKAPDLYLFKNDPGRMPIHFQYGQTVAYWNAQNEK